jgi:hypothetical protein
MLCLLAGLAATSAAYAWSMGGHRVTGVMAARTLAATSPQAVAAIVAIMRAHPAAGAFDSRVDAAGSEPLPRLERLFAEMAQWPDEVRSGPLKQFHRGNWHTIGIPHVAPGYMPSVEPVINAENLLWALRENARIVADTAAADTDRAVALCWIFHLVGDMHQPLHAISLYNAMFPDGDRYGTQFWVRQPHGGEAISLHYFWDSTVQRSQNMAEVEKTALSLTSAHPPANLEEMRERPFRGAGSFERWLREESHQLAISESYRDGTLAGANAKPDAPRLTESYVLKARAVSARRMALSAYRLAEVLAALLR